MLKSILHKCKNIGSVIYDKAPPTSRKTVRNTVCNWYTQIHSHIH